MRTRTRPRLGRTLMALALSLAVLASVSVASAAPDPERHDTTPTGWGWYTNVTESEMNTFMGRNSMRLIDIEVNDGTNGKFASAMVANSGVFNRSSWHWYFGLTFNQLVKLDEITSGRERPIDVEDYKIGSKRRYAVVTVDNVGTNAKTWWWYFGASKTFIKNNLKNRRIIDIDPRPGTSGKYNTIMIRNKGEDARAWWYYYRRTPSQIKNLLKDNKGRLIDIERDGSGKYTIVMVKRSGEYWWWYYGITAKRLGELLAQNGARLVDIERYSTSKGKRYAVIMLNNLDKLSTKVREIMKPGAKKASFGFYLKEVAGPTWAALQDKFVFEPASAIKVLHLLTAMQATMPPGATATLTELVTWFARPGETARYPGDTDYSDDKNKCAYQNDGTPQTSVQYSDPLGEVILRQMMEQSDNRTTDAVVNRFGFAAINATADSVGMTKTELNHRIGCPSAAVANFKRNELTLFDAGLLYEGVESGNLVGTGAVRNSFYDYMVNGTSGWKPLVDEVASELGKTQDVADAFLAEVKIAVKGGSYTNGASCPSGVSGVCQLIRRTGVGLIWLPFKDAPTGAGGTLLRAYVYGSFVDGEFQCGSNCNGEDDKIGKVRTAAHFAMLKPRIKEAMKTW